MSLELFRFANLSAVEGISHAVSTRLGGVSRGRCASLNVSHSVGDDTANVEENLRRLAAAVGTERERFFSPYQVHGRAVVVVDATTAPRPKADVLVTRSSDRTLLLRYA
ncbi:MAG: polyphenol oxidase family protein, partial [Chloroflexota bacterium]|nr:polyphenol oxidase family protein [Chloroflexota bacterium]